jgi:hypothetical protein
LPHSQTQKSAIILRLAFAVWLALLVVVSIFPVSFKLKLHTVGPYHDYGHYIAFILTGIFIWLIAGRTYGKVLGFAGGAAFSFAQEWAENKLYHAGFEWKDVATDGAGLITGFALMLLITSLFPGGRQRHY